MATFAPCEAASGQPWRLSEIRVWPMQGIIVAKVNWRDVREISRRGIADDASANVLMYRRLMPGWLSCNSDARVHWQA
jgi:hypothetical protein